MSLNETPRGVRTHISLFGKRNAGKSSVINALTGQETAIVSEVKGTTTDPVFKAIEILPIGPCVLIDTAGIDDEGCLGELRIKKTIEVLDKTDVALLVIDGETGIDSEDKIIIERIREKSIPIIIVFNKIDKVDTYKVDIARLSEELKYKIVPFSAVKKLGVDTLKNEIIKVIPEDEDKFKIVGDLINPGDVVVLVTPIDKAAPKGRLILPQQQVIRDVLESDALAIVTKEHELKEALESLARKPKLVITDSQVFLKVDADTPKDIMLTFLFFLRDKRVI